MGIKHFFSWFKNNNQMKQAIFNLPPQHIDHVLIDMNGIIHESSQFVFKYGKCGSRIELPKYLKSKVKKPTVEDLYLKIQQKVNKIINTLNPQKSIYLAIDGVAPKSKQNQQRQRRFRAAMEKSKTQENQNIPQDSNFDSNCITAGTEFMFNLSKKLQNLSWIKSSLQIKISTDSDPGEGEHKLIDWIRFNKETHNDIFCIVGLDADLLMLCCLLNPEKVFIMREDDFGINYVDIELTRKLLPISVHDLLILSCFVGNDFLPPIPSLEIKESNPEKGALDYFFEIYEKYYPSFINRQISPPCRALLVNQKNNYINFKALKFIFQKISEREQNIMNARYHDNDRFPNELWTGDIEIYRNKYHEIKLNKSDKKKIINTYMKTVQWVYHYYSKGIPSWDWFYPFNYTLHADSFAEHCPINILKFGFKQSKPSHPHEQLLRVIPLSNKYLLPSYLHKELERISKTANTFKIDKAGKRQEWEAITIVDFVNPKIQNYENIILGPTA